MKGVRERGFDTLLRTAFAQGTPILGICLGMQLLLSSSEEDGGVAGIGLIDGDVRLFDETRDRTAKIPHMGWNTVNFQSHPLFDGLEPNAAFYFVHSYFARPTHAEDRCGVTDYCGEMFASVIASRSLFATQFHPERSGAAGAQLLKNFLTWEGVPCCSNV